MIRGIFYYVYVLWTRAEIEVHSINVLEAHARDICGRVFLDKAKDLGCVITHTIAFVDNTSAELIAENGRTSTATLHTLNKIRLEDLSSRGIYETNERVTSIDNDVADLISRGDIEGALRFPRDCNLTCVELPAGGYRDLPDVVEA